MKNMTLKESKEYRMRIKCCACGKFIGFKQCSREMEGTTTHGFCNKCADGERKKWLEKQKGR